MAEFEQKQPSLLELAAEAMALHCGVNYAMATDLSREHWREHVWVALNAMAKHAPGVRNEEAREAIPRLVEFIRKEAEAARAASQQVIAQQRARASKGGRRG